MEILRNRVIIVLFKVKNIQEPRTGVDITMETKETSKPRINRVRRQLLLGAGLAPVVVTLHAAKVFAADDLKAASLSGAATYSGAIAKSGFNDTRKAGDEIEQELYVAVCNNANERNMGMDEQQYYGAPGTASNGDTTSYGGAAIQLLAWTLGTEEGAIGWTKEYEERFSVPTLEFEAKVKTLADALVVVNTYNALSDADKAAAEKPDVSGADTGYEDTRAAFRTLCDSITVGDTVGVHDFCNDVDADVYQKTTGLLTDFAAAVALMNA